MGDERVGGAGEAGGVGGDKADEGDKENNQCPMPHAPCPMPYALCPMPKFRSNPKDIGKLYVRSQKNQMIPLSNLVTVTPTVAAQTINHYNLFRSIEINGAAAPGSSSGDAIKAMEQVAKEVLPAGYGYEWSGTALEEIDSGGLAPLIFGLGIIFVFLVLAAQYENYVDPFIILLSVPLAIFGAL